MIKKLNERGYVYSGEENVRYLKNYKKYISQSRGLLNELDKGWDRLIEFAGNAGDNQYYGEEVQVCLSDFFDAFNKLNRSYYKMCDLLDEIKQNPEKLGKQFESKRYTKKRGLYESNSNLFGVRLYDPYSGEYVVYWSEDKNSVREMYDILRDSTWIRYDDLHDFVDQINPRFNKFTWEDIDFGWDYDEFFIGDGVHESYGEIDIIYEVPLDTKHYTESK